ncbi:WYL domain-containing protein [Herbiconiux moechotypicola]|uniref:WYL domain-containing protein n=2 Tax=Herbiconiux moechotypicola TaxID=637393 RepID=A0ABN3D8W2_9MICO
MLLLLSLLQSRRDWPGQLLAERLEVAPRTVRRDVERLRTMGYRIRAVKGPDGGYRLDAGAELPPLLFDDDQALALAVALQSAAANGIDGTSGTGGLSEAAVRALTTVRQVLPTRLRHRLDAIRFSALQPASGPTPPVSPDVLITLSTAIRAREILRFDYASLATAPAGASRAADSYPPAPRRVEPHHLVTANGRWYLVAWSLDRADWRLYRADRITPRIPTGPRFTPRDVPGGDVHAFVSARFKGSDARDEWPCTGTVVLHLPATAVTPFAGDGTVTPEGPDRTRYTAGAWSWTALAASLGRFDAPLDVLDPPELAAAFSTLSDRYAAAAGSPPG